MKRLATFLWEFGRLIWALAYGVANHVLAVVDRLLYRPKAGNR